MVKWSSLILFVCYLLCFCSKVFLCRFSDIHCCLYVVNVLFLRFLHARLRTATLRSDYEGQASLLNLILRNYLHYNLIEQADKLVSKSTFPESTSNNEWARFLYYLGNVFNYK